MSEAFALRVCALAETTSTNDEIKRALAAGEAEGLAVRARRQTGGYGRQGRTWASPEGGLYFSVLLRPEVDPATLPTLSLATGLAVRRALSCLADAQHADGILVKWPNDVVRAPAPAASPHRAAAPAKLCGISLEALGGGVCVGIGVNVMPPDETPQVGGKNLPAYLSDASTRIAALPVDAALDCAFEAIAGEFAVLYGRWQSEGFAPLREEYDACSSLTGRGIVMVDRDDAPLVAGEVARVDAFGRLIVRAADGREVPVCSGEAHIV